MKLEGCGREPQGWAGVSNLAMKKKIYREVISQMMLLLKNTHCIALHKFTCSSSSMFAMIIAMKGSRATTVQAANYALSKTTER